MSEKPTYEELEQRVERMEALIKNSQIATVQLTEDNIITEINPEFTRLFGFKQKDVVGKYIDPLLAPQEYRVIPANGFEVPVLATFNGLKRLPRQISFSHNNLNPYLTLFEDRIECRVMLKKAILLSQIENVDIWDTFATRNLQIYVKGKEDLFTANLLNRMNLSRVLNFLVNRGVPLSSRAKVFLSVNSA